MRWGRLLAVLLTGAFGVPQVRAQVEVSPDYIHNVWTNTEDGLPVNTIRKMVRSQAGYLWLMTLDGLVRFDGDAFTVYNTANTSSLTTNRFRDIAEDAEGRLWYLLEDETMGVVEHGRFTPMSSPARGGPFRTLHAEPSHGMLVRHDYGVSRMTDTTLTHVWSTPLLTEHLAHAHDGALWVSVDRGRQLVRIAAVDTTVFDETRIGEVKAIYPDPTSPDVWVGTTRGLWRHSSADGIRLITDTVSPEALMRTPDGRLWFGASTGLYSYTSGTVTEVAPWPKAGETLQLLPHQDGGVWARRRTDLWHNAQRVLHLEGDGQRLEHIGYDGEGNLWVQTTRAGLHRLRPHLFRTYGVTDGAHASNTYSVVEGPGGVVWMGTIEGGITQISQGEARVWHDAPSTMYNMVFNATGGVWHLGERILYSPSTDVPQFSHQAPDETWSSVAYDVHEDNQGCVWLGTRAGLWRTCGAQCDLITTVEGQDIGRVRGFRATADGALWMATTGAGIVVYHNGVFRRISEEHGLSSNRVRALYQDADGYWWAGTEGWGLNRVKIGPAPTYEVEQVATYGTADGLYDSVIHTILEDDTGRFWMSTNRGIFWVFREDLNAFAERQIDRIFSVSYDERDGLRDREANGGTFSAGLQASDGRLWFATQAGAVVVNPADVTPEVTEVPTAILSVQAGDALWTVEGTASVILPLGMRDVDVHYTGIHFTKPSAVRFRYRLGADQPWTEAGTRRDAIYTNLVPGRYDVEVIASAYPGYWPESGATLRVTVPPYLYETMPFNVVLAVTGLALVWAGFNWRARRHKRREAELEAQVAERTEEIRQQAEQLKSLDETKSRFFTNISHEFRTPLTLTIGPLEDLNRGHHGPLSATVRESIQQVLLSSRRLLRLVNQLLDVAKIEAHQLHLNRQPLDLAAYLRVLAEVFVPLAQRKAITFQQSIPTEPVAVSADPEHLEKVFTNLLSNAFKFTPQGGRIALTLALTEEAVRVVVRDNGPGIPASELVHVFDRFHRASSPETAAQVGTGVGLALAKELVELHEGEIHVESEEGFGAIFTVVVPRLAWSGDGLPEMQAPPAAMAAAEQAPSVADVDRAEEETADRPTVLVVDDNADIRRYVRSHLESAYNVVEAAHGAEGLAQARTMLPDLIVSDVMMPEMDGYELCRAVKADSELDFIPVILLTAKASSESKLEGLSEGADDYLTKPFSSEELTARIENLIRQRHRLRERFMATASPSGPTEESTATPAAQPSAEDVWAERVRRIVEAHMADETFTVDALAAQLGVSRTTLYSQMQDLMGISPAAYLWQVRLEHAAHLLETQAGTVSEIAYGVGFKSVQHFARRFRAVYGCTPTQYAKAHQAADEA
ncbi:MAG: hybrid sensor histidine kinase/response regulator transcription factor [Rhodothermales bacterium]